ncbi:MAG TPA: hypothetical protein VMU77_02980 [Acidimicrobiales bacterium]|nr:hypothetical protein [Acidimicrobiales bacterium]
MKEGVLTPDSEGIPLPEDEIEEPIDDRRPIWMPPPHFVLGLTILLCLPSTIHFVVGTVSVAGILARVLVAVLISWIGLALVGNIINAYLPEPQEDEIIDPIALGFAGGYPGDQDYSNLGDYSNPGAQGYEDGQDIFANGGFENPVAPPGGAGIGNPGGFAGPSSEGAAGGTQSANENEGLQ